jgi:DNA repair protein RadC
MYRPHALRALLHVQLAAHPRVVFAAILLTRRWRLIDYVELFNGTTDHVVVHARVVVQEVLRRHAEAVIVARSDPTGEGKVSARDMADARKLKAALGCVEIRLLDYLVVGKTIGSMAERQVV